METDRTPNLPTNIMDFRGFDSSIILILWGGILMSIGDFPELWKPTVSGTGLGGCSLAATAGGPSGPQSNFGCT